MSFQIKVARTETNLPLNLVLSDAQGPVTGATVVVALRDADTVDSYLDFNDDTFKTSLWTTRQASLTEGEAGVYTLSGGQDVSAITNLPAGTENLLAEYEVTGPAETVGISSDIILLEAAGGGGGLTIGDVQTAMDNQGYTAARAVLLDNLDATISTVNTAIGNLNDLSSADIQAAMDAQGYTAARAVLIDNLDAAISTVSTAIAGLNDISTADVQTIVDGLNDLSTADVQTAMDSQGYTAVRAALLDNLDTALSAVNANVSAVGVAVMALNDLSTADVQTAMDSQGYTAARAVLIDNLDAAISTVLADTAGISSMATRLTLVEKLLRNRLETDPVSGVATLYDDDSTTPLLTGNIFQDVAGTQAYQGTGLERRNRLV